MKDSTLTDESLYTFLVEVEWIMNTRPLTPVSDSPNDFSALTPMSLLCGSLDSSLPPDVFFQADEYRRSWRAVQLLSGLILAAMDERILAASTTSTEVVATSAQPQGW